MTAQQQCIAIVTGANSGIGLATTEKFAHEATVVFALDRHIDTLRSLQKEQPSIVPVRCDVTDHAALELCVADVIERYGRIDILVNNAGFSFYERHAESSLEHWRETLAVNVEAMYVLSKLVVPHMMEEQYGRIVNISSTQSIAAESVVGAYAASKGAVNAWSRVSVIKQMEQT